MTAVKSELFTGELVRSLRGFLDSSFLDGIPDQSSLVDGHDVIHLNNVGVDPRVLINNTTYPIPEEILDDKDLALKLDKFQSTATPITDDELYACTYDKVQRVKDSHAYALHDAKLLKAAHALTPNKHTATTPVLAATGELDHGRRRLTMHDVINLKKALDKLRVPPTDRRLVLCVDHVNDLLHADQRFRDQYHNTEDGRITRLYGFTIYEYDNCPVFTKQGVKKAIGSAIEAGEYQGSFAFYTRRVFKASGSTRTYHSAANTDPLNLRNLLNFRTYFLCMPKREDAAVAVYSPHEG